MAFTFARSETLPDVILITSTQFGDDRGWFMETHKVSDFSREGIVQPFVQSGISHSTLKGIIRGLHYQKDPAAQGKLVRVSAGEIFDVAVDLRQGSPTFARWTSAKLSRENRAALWIPPGFAHGFCTLSEDVEVVYEMTAEYVRNLDRCLRWDDPHIAIDWPTGHPVGMSVKDANAPLLDEADINFTYPSGGGE